MKIGIAIHHYDQKNDAILDAARSAGQQGYDSVWLRGHLFRTRGNAHKTDSPLDQLALATVIGAVTQQTRLAWGFLTAPCIRRPC